MKIRFKALAFLAIVLCVLLSIEGNDRQADDPGVLLRAAIEKEEVEGDLQGAIALYKEIIASYGTSRAVAAKAQLHIGHCYQKLGLKQAQDAYQQVVDEFPEQKEAVKVAREKLKLLRQMETMAQSNRRDFRMSKVMEGLGKVSPDGRFIASPNWRTGNISIYEINSGKKREIDLGGNTEGPSPEFIGFLAWSPDGKALAYSWSTNMHDDLRVIDLAGGDPRILYRSDDINYIVPVDWSPDGKSILIAGSGKATRGSPAIFSIKEKTLDLIEMGYEADMGYEDQNRKIDDSVGFSPDGKYILFTVVQLSERGRKDILLYSLSDKKTISLIESPANDIAMGWTADGKYLIYTSDRTGTVDLWMSEIAAAKTIGDPILIKKNIGSIKSAGVSPDGALFYVLRTGFVDVQVTEVDIEKGESLSEPFRVDKLYKGENTWPKWSPDGKQLLYVSERSKTPQRAGSQVLCIYTLETKELKELKPTLKDIRHGIWAPDGKSLLVVGGENDNHGLHKVDTTTGHTSLVYKYDDGTWVFSPAYTKNGKKVYFRSLKWHHLYSERYYKISSYDMETQKVETLFTTTPETAAYLYELALSPDESRISFFTQSLKPICTILYIMSSQGGEPREIIRYSLPDTIVRHCWTPDGQNLILAIGNWKTGVTKLYKVSIDSGQTHYLGLEANFLHSFSLHQDGKHLAFSSGKSAWEIWMVENFLPQDIDK